MTRNFNTYSRWLTAAALLAAAPLAMAHPGHDNLSLAAGFMHPLTGLDHLLVMIAVGLWAGKLGGAARWQLPLTFVLLMAVGAALGMAGVSLPGLETLVAATVMALGLLLALSVRLSTAARLALVAVFALLHGLAHGGELAGGSALLVMAGMLVATAMLHALGLLLASGRAQLPVLVHRLFGCTMMVLGAWIMSS